MDEKISIIIPVYNVENYIRKCIDSVINQTYKNLEIILIDDGTPDNSGKICDEYAEKDSRIIVLHNENMGLSGARNCGLDIATGKYVSFIDSDDYVDTCYIEKLYNALKSENADMAICKFKYIFEKDYKNINIKSILPYKTKVFNSEQALNNMYSYSKRAISFVTAWGGVAKIELFDGVRYPIGKIIEDEYTTYKLYMKCNKISYYNEPLYYYVQRTGSILNSPFTIEKVSMVDVFDEKLNMLRANAYNHTYNLTLSRYYLMLYFVKAKIIRNKLDYDIKLIDDKISKLDNMSLEHRMSFKILLNKILEKYFVKYCMKIYSKI